MLWMFINYYFNKNTFYIYKYIFIDMYILVLNLKLKQIRRFLPFLFEIMFILLM